jgi:hypothetical protein
LPALEDDGGGIDEVDDDGGDSTESATSRTESATSSTEASTNSTESATFQDGVRDEHVLGERLIRVCGH